MVSSMAVQAQEVQDRVQTNPEGRTTSSVSSQLSVQPATQIHGKSPDQYIRLYHGRYFENGWNIHITSRPEQVTKGRSPQLIQLRSAAPGMRSLEISANVGTACATNLDSSVHAPSRIKGSHGCDQCVKFIHIINNNYNSNNKNNNIL